MEIGQQVTIQSFKHNGSLHRTWSRGTLIEMRDDYWVVVTYKTLVVESNKRIWQTREPAICFFYPDRWYNVICMIRKNGVHFYCNIASPTLYDGEALKYIDYDLDLKVFPDYKYKVLDEDEYEAHRKLMGYSVELDKILKAQLQNLIEMTYNMSGPFRPDFAQYWYSVYQSMLESRRKR